MRYRGRIFMLTIRFAKKEDVERIADIELECFPVAEAADRETLKIRFEAFGENFLVAEKDGKVVGFINGCTTNTPELQTSCIIIQNYINLMEIIRQFLD